MFVFCILRPGENPEGAGCTVWIDGLREPRILELQAPTDSDKALLSSFFCFEMEYRCPSTVARTFLDTNWLLKSL